MTDIKETLGNAFGDEPPLRIDRAAIVRSGKRKLMVRNAGTGMAVIAAVAVISVPTLLGGRGGGIGMGGASSSSAPPLTTVTTTTVTTTTESPTNQPPTSAVTSAPDHPGRETSKPVDTDKPAPPKPVTDARAAELTALLASSGVLPEAEYTPIPAGRLGMRVTSDESGYELAADMTTATGSGQLRLLLSTYEVINCAELPPTPGVMCEQRDFEGERVVVQDYSPVGVGGDYRLAVQYELADGTAFMAAVAGPRGSNPPLTWQQLAKIATLPGVAF